VVDGSLDLPTNAIAHHCPLADFLAHHHGNAGRFGRAGDWAIAPGQGIPQNPYQKIGRRKTPPLAIKGIKVLALV